ncbi:MAG: PKD domain-containing protein [Chthoniobacterales bacterium]
MQKNSRSESAFSIPRLAFAFVLCVTGLFLAVFSFGTPAPTSGTLSTSNRSISYTDATGAPPNLTPVATGTPNCGPTGALCSIFNLTIDPTVGTTAAGYDPTQYQIALQWSWATSAVDFDIFIEDSTNAVVAKNTSTADPSTIILPTNITPGLYKLIVVLSTGAPIPYTGTVTLDKLASTAGGPGLCNPAVSNCAPTRFQSYPAGAGQADNAGEPSLGVDWNPNVAALQHDLVNAGGLALFTSGSNEFRVTFDDCSSPAIYDWADVSALTDQTFVLSDPIGFVDHYSSLPLGLSYPPVKTPGRGFAIDLIGGQGDSLGAFSDDDFNTSSNGGNGGAGAGPDHQTLGAGPYFGSAPAGASYPSNSSPGALHGVYYCSQNIVAESQCSRSDNGGVTFGPSVPIFNPTVCTGGITGHVKVAPDGTVYVPNSSCGTTGTAGVAVSIDNGLTWVENNVPGSTSSQDPYVGIGQNNVGKPAGNLNGTNTIYLGYNDGNGHPKVAFSGNRGATWSLPVDLGVPYGITHAVFPIAAAGDDNRAAISFVGTGDGISTNASACDPYGATLNCANIWHLYVATTYDGGQNWITTDATPNDPIQTGTVCLQGTTCAGGRNLLDFNDMAIDSQGRILAGYADGCVRCTNTFQGQSSASHGTVTRQSGGRRLFAFFDPNEPTAPANPQMVSAVFSGTAALVTWLEPDNGGSPITGYKVYRGTTSGGETFLASVAGASTNKYLDPAPPAGPVYYYTTAVNAQGDSSHCREVSLGGSIITSGNACTFPYLQVDGPGSAGTAPDPTTNGELTIQNVNIGEPFLNCVDNSLTFLMKVDSLDTTGTGMAILPQNTEYQILFTLKDTSNATHTAYVELDTFAPNTPATPGVSLGRRDPCTAGCGTLDSSVSSTLVSATYTADGTIQIKLDASNPIVFPAPGAPATGPAYTWDPRTVGTQLTSVTGNTLLFVGAGAGFLETVSVTGTGNYTRVGNQSCSTVIPIAALSATPISGPAPLTVNFDGTASREGTGGCGTISSYTIDYGDNASGQPRDTATNNTGIFSHTFTAAGDYNVRLTVTDTNTKASTNVAQQVISVAGGPPPVAGVVSRKTHGAAGTFDIIMPVTGPAGIECRTGLTPGSHNLVVVLQNPITSVASVSATYNTGSGAQPLPTPTGVIGTGAQNNQYSVSLTGVPNASHVFVTLHGAVDSAGNSGDIPPLPADFLLGDVNGTSTVDGADVSMAKSGTRQAVGATNYRSDVDVTGLIDGNDVSLIQGHTRTTLSSPPNRQKKTDKAAR